MSSLIYIDVVRGTQKRTDESPLSFRDTPLLFHDSLKQRDKAPNTSSSEVIVGQPLGSWTDTHRTPFFSVMVLLSDVIDHLLRTTFDRASNG